MALNEARTVVVTGGSAGVGRATAQAFARRGWNVALIARDFEGLENACKDIVPEQTLGIVADLADAQAVSDAAEQVVRKWGAIDVWINNAMVTMYAEVANITPDEFRRITEVTYLGCVYGTMSALRHMRPRNCGTIVQIGSALAYRAIPLQSAYCGAKFAIRGFTDTLRTELLRNRSGIRLVMVQLPAINTPQFDWTRNKTGRRARPVAPIFQPEAAANAIVSASLAAEREVWVGWSSLKAIVGNMIAPTLLDRLLSKRAYDGQLESAQRVGNDPDNLFRPVSGLHASRGRFDREAYGQVATIHPRTVRLACALLALGALAASAAFVATSVRTAARARVPRKGIRSLLDVLSTCLPPRAKT